MDRLKNIKTPFFLKLVFIFSFYELVIGGGGRFLEVGSVTFRMIFFLIAIVISIFMYVHKNSIKKNLVILIFSFSVLLLFSSVIGLANNASLDLVLEDVKPLSFFYMIFFFSLAINNIEDIELVNKIIKQGAVFLSISYLSVIILLFYGYIDFGTFYNKQNEIGEVMFRGDSLFFYKGFLYLCIGFFFFLLSKDKYKILFLILIFASIALTLTRGFIIFTALISCYYVFFINKAKVLKWMWALVLFGIVIIGGPLFIETLGDRSDSDTVRYIQIDQVYDAVNPLSIFIGHGFGIGVPDRPVHMENSFLEIYHKQGLLGIAFWMMLFGYTVLLYFRIKDIDYKKTSLPFLLSVVFIFFQSLTNPFVNNPIGLSMLLITIVIFSKFLDLQKQN
jgi:hypothetical protein